MSVYRVHFRWKDKERTIKARELDMTHPYFVSIKDLIFPEPSRLVIDPNEDELRKEFGEADHLMFPFQSVTLIEELRDATHTTTGRVIPFSVVDRTEADDSTDDDTTEYTDHE